MESVLVWILSTLAGVGFFFCCAFWLCGAQNCHVRNPCANGPVGFFCPGDEPPPEREVDRAAQLAAQLKREKRRERKRAERKKALKRVVVEQNQRESEVEGRPEPKDKAKASKKEHAARLAEKRDQREKRRAKHHQGDRDGHQSHRHRRHGSASEEKQSSGSEESSSDTSSGSDTESQGEPEERKSDIEFLRAATLRAVEIRLEALNSPQQVLPVSVDPAELPAAGRPSSKSLSGSASKDALMSPGKGGSSSRPASSLELDRQANRGNASSSPRKGSSGGSHRPASSMDLDQPSNGNRSGGSARPASSLDLDRPANNRASRDSVSLSTSARSTGTVAALPKASPFIDLVPPQVKTPTEPSAPTLSRDNSSLASGSTSGFGRPVPSANIAAIATPSEPSAPYMPQASSPASTGPGATNLSVPTPLDRPNSLSSISTVPGAPVATSSAPSAPPRIKNRSYYRSQGTDQPQSSSDLGSISGAGAAPQPGMPVGPTDRDDLSSVRSGASSQPGAVRVRGELSSIRSVGSEGDGSSIRTASLEQPGA